MTFFVKCLLFSNQYNAMFRADKIKLSVSMRIFFEYTAAFFDPARMKDTSKYGLIKNTIKSTEFLVILLM